MHVHGAGGIDDDGAVDSVLGAVLLDALRRVSVEVRIRAGDVLCSEGDVGDALFVVQSGRLEVYRTADESHFTIRYLAAGDVVGELALLCQSPRAASIRAVRDTTLWSVTSEGLHQVLEREPSFAAALVRVLGEKLRTRPVASLSRPLSVVTVMALDAAAPTDPIADALARALAQWRPVRCVRLDDLEDEEAAWHNFIEGADRDEVMTLLVIRDADRGGSWASFCVRQSDRVIGVAGAVPSAVELHHDWDLVLCDRAAQPFSRRRWLSRMDPRAHHQVMALAESDIQRLARRITGHSVGLVLSGGGARGLAHLGVIDTLVRAGFVIDRVGGTSMGALIAALVANGLTPGAAIAGCRREFKERRPFRDYTVPRASLIRGRQAQAMLGRLLGPGHLEDLQLDCFSVSADLSTAQLVVHRRGPLVERVGASMSLPGLAPPMRSDGRLLVDGGVLNNVPVDVMVEQGEGPVIAVDVMTHSPLGQRSNRLPSIVETLARATVIGSHEQAAKRLAMASAVIAPELGTVGLLEFSRLDEIVEAGRQATRQALTRDLEPLVTGGPRAVRTY